MTSTRSAAATGLPIPIIAADPIPGLASRIRTSDRATDAAEQARAMNAVLADLNAILAEGGAHV